MPAKRRTETPSPSTDDTDTGHQEDPMYKEKRQKNNEAVQRTREKTKKSNEDRKTRIDTLRRENANLEGEIKIQKECIKVLRELIMKGIQNESHAKLIDKIVNSSDDKDDDKDGDTKSK